MTLLDCSPAWVTQPPATCSTAVGAIPARSSRAIWMPPSSAPDEIVRWATPITVFQRTTTRDTVLGGQEIRAGQRVGLFYRSANFDEEVFDHPERFDVLRSPNPHLGYGGLGTHYCLGASPAKLEIELIFNAIADAMPDIAKAGDPVPPPLRLDQRHQEPSRHLPSLAPRTRTPQQATRATTAP